MACCLYAQLLAHVPLLPCVYPCGAVEEEGLAEDAVRVHAQHHRAVHVHVLEVVLHHQARAPAEPVPHLQNEAAQK